MNNIIPLYIIIPLAAAFLIALLGRRVRPLVDGIAFTAVASLCFFSFIALIAVSRGTSLVYFVGGWKPPFGISFVLDGLSSFMLLVVNLASVFICLFSVQYMEKYTAKWKFYVLFLLMLAGMNGVLITGDIFNLFVFLEIASIASYALVAFGADSCELEASLKYMVMSVVASFFILLAIGFLYAYTSSLNMSHIASLLGGEKTVVSLFIGVMFFIGFGLKAALVPFHGWLPDAHPSAPAPISAALSGVLIKTLGIYAMIRILYNVMGLAGVFSKVLMFLGGVSMLVGALLALGQKDFKRILAYSSISQIGYIALGFGLYTPLGVVGGLFHLFNHSLFKPLLFLSSGAVEYATGTRNIEEMGGLRERMPQTAAANLVGAMSISGVPPFNGFWSKLVIVVACVQSGHLGYAFLAVGVSVITLSYLMKIQRRVFFGTLSSVSQSAKEVPIGMRFALLCLAVLCLLSAAVIIPGFSGYFLDPARDVILSVFSCTGLPPGVL